MSTQINDYQSLAKLLKISLTAVYASKLINITKILFFYMPPISTLAIEFNGLVSTKGQQKC
jgi:hypothetical protein